jgi:hypothetical protein
VPDSDRSTLLVALAQAKIVLATQAPATEHVMATLTRLEAVMPLPGTPEHRAIFREAHAILGPPHARL